MIALLILLIVLDGLTTWAALRSPKAVEANPVVRFLIDRIGVPVTMLLKSAVSAGLVFFLRGETWAIACACFVYGALVVNNALILRKLDD